jgi:hypothetical protein
MEPEYSLLCSQEIASGFYSQADESNSHSHITFRYFNISTPSHLYLGFANELLLAYPAIYKVL